MRSHSTTRLVLKRYLTPFYYFALGLAFLVFLSACDGRGDSSQGTPSATQEMVDSLTAPPEPSSTQLNSRKKPTQLPAIPPTPNQKTPTNLGVSVADIRGLEITVWYPWAGEMGTELQSILDAYSRTNQWGITVVGTSYADYGRLDEAVDSAISTHSLPDVVVDYAYQAQRWDASGVIADLTPYVDDPVWGLTNAEQGDFIPGFWDANLVMGGSSGQSHQLGIPFFRSAYVLFYNQSWAREMGYATPPATRQDFQTQACAAAKQLKQLGGSVNAGKGGWLITPQPATLLGWIYAFGGEVVNPAGAGYSFNTSEAQSAFEYIKGLQDGGCAWQDNTAGPFTEFAHRRALFVVGSLYDIPAQQEALSQEGNKDEWVPIPFPSSKQPRVVTYGPSLVVTQSTPARELAAWLVIKWLVYTPNLTAWVDETATYPTRSSILDYLSENGSASPQWKQALELLPDARDEPSLASWGMVRWALNDALAELIAPKVTADQIPSILENLDSVASEIFDQVK